MDPDEGTLPTADVSPGSSVLVAGPPMSGKHHMQLRLVADLGERRILVSTEDSAEVVRSEFEAVAGDVADDEFGIVDCVSARSADVTDTEFVKYAPSAENLTAIGVKFTDLAETLRARGDSPVSVGFDSLSTLLMFFDVQRVYRFVRVFAGQIEDSGWTGVATVGSTMHDEQALHTLYDPFDAVIETRLGDDGREFRLRDRSGTGEWTEF